MKQEIIDGVRYRSVKGFEDYLQIGENGIFRILERIRGVNGHVGNNTKERFSEGQDTGRGYNSIKIFDKHFLAHKTVAQMFLGHSVNGSRAYVVNHKDRNTKNNKLDNLEVTTQRRNSNYHRSELGYSSDCVGIHFAKLYGKWQARIFFMGDRINLGYFDKESDACNAYKSALKPYDAIELRQCNMYGFDRELLKEIINN